MYSGQIFKSLELDDYIITPFFAYKEWTWTTDDIESGYVQFLYGKYNSSSILNVSLEPTNSNGMLERSVYDVINHLYYASSSDPYRTFSDWNSGNTECDLKSEFVYIGIPAIKFGDTIKKGTFSLTAGDYTVTDDGYGNLITGNLALYTADSEKFVTIDGEDVLVADFGTSGTDYIGNIFYETGDVVFTDTSSLAYIEISESYFDTFSYKGKVKITEHTIFCSANRGELTMTQNPTAYSGSVINGIVVSGSGLPLDTILSSSEWNPYITTIGLYNDSGDLLIVGKLAKPVINDKNMDLSFTVKFDT